MTGKIIFFSALPIPAVGGYLPSIPSQEGGEFSHSNPEGGERCVCKDCTYYAFYSIVYVDIYYICKMTALVLREAVIFD